MPGTPGVNLCRSTSRSAVKRLKVWRSTYGSPDSPPLPHTRCVVAPAGSCATRSLTFSSVASRRRSSSNHCVGPSPGGPPRRFVMVHGQAHRVRLEALRRPNADPTHRDEGDAGADAFVAGCAHLERTADEHHRYEPAPLDHVPPPTGEGDCGARRARSLVVRVVDVGQGHWTPRRMDTVKPEVGCLAGASGAPSLGSHAARSARTRRGSWQQRLPVPGRSVVLAGSRFGS